jgi:NAD(P)-dependent dehydrogenase (short-subunit alcohol dehydrogenase family)
MHLQEKIAVISGGARGLGRAYTEAILKAGGKVLLIKNVYNYKFD